MSLAERLSTARPKPRGLPCPVASILEQVAADDAAALTAALNAPHGSPTRLGARVLADELSAEGYEIHHAGIEKHRRKSCRCYRGSGL